MEADVADDAIPGFFSLGTDTGAVTDGMLVGTDAAETAAATGAVEAATGAVEAATGAATAAGATIEAAVEAAVEAADCTAATDDAIADCTAATDDAIADSMAGAADAVTDVVDAIPGRFSFGAATAEAAGTAAAGTEAAGAAAGAEAAAAAFDRIREGLEPAFVASTDLDAAVARTRPSVTVEIRERFSEEVLKYARV